MPLPTKDLLKLCADVVRGYDNTLAPEDYLNEFLQDVILNDVEVTFVHEVFSGCLRYGEVVQVLLKGFYIQAGKGVLLSDEPLFLVLGYLMLFRLDELGLQQFKNFVREQNFNTMYKFFSYVCDESKLTTWVKLEWCQLYDAAFVQTNIISPMIKSLPALHELVVELKEKVDAKHKPKVRTAQPTKPKPFDLTQPRARSVPFPEPIPKLKPHNPVPATTYAGPKEVEMIQQVKVANRRQAEERMLDATKRQFSCANAEKSAKTKQKLNAILQEEEEKLQFDARHSKPAPVKILNSEVPIRLNAAHILREGKLFKEREEEVIKRLESLESGAYDASAFLQWQQEMRQRDLEQELAAIERRRLEGKLSHDEAILARQEIIRDNQRKVEEMKAESKELMARYLEQRLQEEEEMRKLVEVVMEGRDNAKDAKKKLQAYKAKIVQEVNEESKELMRQALEEAEMEMRKKVELIHQIRAMEAAPMNRQKLVDFTETAGYRLLSEMSLAELRERLALLKDKQKAEEDEKREEILISKEVKDRALMQTLEMISKHRTEDTRARAEKTVVKKSGQKGAAIETKDKQVLELRQRLEKRHAERLQLQEQFKVVPDKETAQRLQSIAKEKASSEQRRWAELEESKKRAAQLQTQGVLSSKAASRLTSHDGSRLALSMRPFVVT